MSGMLLQQSEGVAADLGVSFRWMPCAVFSSRHVAAAASFSMLKYVLAALLHHQLNASAGVTLLPSRSAGHVLARGLTASGQPQGPSRKTTGPPPGPQVTMSVQPARSDQSCTVREVKHMADQVVFPGC